MTKKEIRRIATRKLNEGKKRQQVLTEIQEETQAPVADIAAVLKFTPSKRTKKKYKLVNSLLLTILILTIVSKLAMGTLLVLANGIAWLPLLFLVPLINIYLAYEVANYKGQIYKWLAVFSLLSFLRSTPSLFNGGVDFLEAIDLIVVGLLIFLGFYLNRKFAIGHSTKRETYINDLGQRRGRDVIFFND